MKVLKRKLPPKADVMGVRHNIDLLLERNQILPEQAIRCAEQAGCRAYANQLRARFASKEQERQARVARNIRYEMIRPDNPMSTADALQRAIDLGLSDFAHELALELAEELRPVSGPARLRVVA